MPRPDGVRHNNRDGKRHHHDNHRNRDRNNNNNHSNSNGGNASYQDSKTLVMYLRYDRLDVAGKSGYVPDWVIRKELGMKTEVLAEVIKDKERFKTLDLDGTCYVRATYKHSNDYEIDLSMGPDPDAWTDYKPSESNRAGKSESRPSRHHNRESRDNNHRHQRSNRLQEKGFDNTNRVPGSGLGGSSSANSSNLNQNLNSNSNTNSNGNSNRLDQSLDNYMGRKDNHTARGSGGGGNGNSSDRVQRLNLDGPLEGGTDHSKPYSKYGEDENHANDMEVEDGGGVLIKEDEE